MQTRCAGIGCLVLAACGSDTDSALQPTVRVTIDGETAAAETSDRFLSYAIDTSSLLELDFEFDFARERLRRMTAEIGPAYLRIGGTPADGVYYDVDSVEPTCTAPAGWDTCLTGARWREACDFATEVGAQILFTLSVGCGPRDADGAWTDGNARAFMERTIADGCPVTVWELGNEIELMRLPDDSRAGCNLDAEQYAADFEVARDLVDSLYPEGGARLAGPATLYWGGIGPLVLEGTVDPVLEPFLAVAGASVDVVTWHYYPQQSSRCDFQEIEALPDTMIDPVRLDEVSTWADEVESLAAKHAPQAEVWLDETGHAVCGGEPCLSDRFVTGAWWLDQLGLLARRGSPVVVRQALTEGRYHLIDPLTLDPYPDYFASLLWTRLMGTAVLAPAATFDAAFDPSRLRLYAHCTPGAEGSVTVLVSNIDPEADAVIGFEGVGEARELYLMTPAPHDPEDFPESCLPEMAPSDLLSKGVQLGGTTLAVAEDGAPPALEGSAVSDPIVVPARSYAFVVLPEANAAACR